MSETIEESLTACPPDGDPLRQMLCFAIYSAGLAFNRAYKPRLDALGITYLQYLALLLLRHRSGQSVKQLGESLTLDSNTLTPLIKRLEAAGFVKRRRDLDDERVVRVDITDLGEKTVDEAACATKDLASKLNISPQQYKALLDQLAELDRKMAPRA